MSAARNHDEDELCAVHHEVQRRLDERWSAFSQTSRDQNKLFEDKFQEVFNRLRMIEIRMWMFLGGMAVLLLLIEKWPKISALMR